MRPNQSASSWGYRFLINRFGLRGCDFAIPKPKDIYRIAFLGDSVTYGGGKVKDPDLFVNQAASNLSTRWGRSVEAVNISAPGWAVANIAAYVLDKGLHNADLAVWIIPDDDFRRPVTSIETFQFPTRKSRLRVLRILKIKSTQLAGRLRPAPPVFLASEVFAGVVKTVKETASTLIARNLPVVVVLVPTEQGYSDTKGTEAFRAMLASLFIPFLDLEPELVNRYSFFRDGQHLATEGHRLAGKAIAAFVDEFLCIDKNNQIADVSRI
jgi:hypothetical protein